MANRGAWAIALMFGVGLSLAGGSVLYHANQGRKCLEFWGSRDGELIRHAPGVEAWTLTDMVDASESSTAQEVVSIDGAERRVARKLDISTARGLVHARHALILDANYDWGRESDANSPIPATAWTHAIRFQRETEDIVLLFDFEGSRVRRLDRLPLLHLVPTIAAAEKALVERELAATASQ